MIQAFRSPAFAEGKPIPTRHTEDGEDLSPALEWSGLPAGTRELALIVDDPDAPGAAGHPILRGIRDGDIWGPTDVYAVKLPLPGDSRPLVLGQVLEGMSPTDKPVEGEQNSPMMPIAWTRTYTPEGGKPARVFTTTMGASQDLQSEGLRRLMVNACYWALGLEDQIAAKSAVDLVGPYDPLPFQGGGHKKGVKPADLAARE